MEEKHKNSESKPQQTLNLENPYDLIDGASGEGFDLNYEFKEQRKIIADKNNWLEDRLEAYEDIMDSEVGDTSMVRARNIEREVGARQIFLKVRRWKSYRNTKRQNCVCASNGCNETWF